MGFVSRHRRSGQEHRSGSRAFLLALGGAALAIGVAVELTKKRYARSGARGPSTTDPSAIGDAAPAPSGIYFPEPGEGLDRQSQKRPEEVGLRPAIVAALADSARRWALWRHGYLVHVSGSFNQVEEVKSLRKTWHAMAAGAALKQGRLASLDEPLSRWATELTGKDAEATWHDVLRQASGFDYPYGSYPAYGSGVIFTYSDLNLLHLCNALARVWGRQDYHDYYDVVLASAYFDAIGMQGWSSSSREDGIRLHLDLEDMGRLGLLALVRGSWNGEELIPRGFVEALETKQTHGLMVNYNGPNDGVLDLGLEDFPEAPYGYLTWTNSDGDYYPGADRGWAWGWGAGGIYILWNRNHGIVYAAVGRIEGTPPLENAVPRSIEAHIDGPNPLVD